MPARWLRICHAWDVLASWVVVLVLRRPQLSRAVCHSRQRGDLAVCGVWFVSAQAPARRSRT
jgi:hypothetical protein